MSKPRLGFHVYRIITIEGPFRPHPSEMFAIWAPATVETQGNTYRVAVWIKDETERAFVGLGEDGKLTDLTDDNLPWAV